VTDSGNPSPGVQSANAAITITVSGPVIWFVDPNAATNGSGVLGNPFKFLSGNAGANNDADDVDNTSHRIFVYSGTMPATNSTLALNTSEWLVGQGVTGFADFDALMGITGTVPNGTFPRPTIGTGTATLQNTVTLQTGAVVKAVTLSTGTTTGLTDPAGATTGVSVDQVTVSTTSGTALSFNDLGGTLNFTSVSANGAGTGISLTAVAAGITIAGGTIQNTTTAAIVIGTTGVLNSGGGGTFTYGGTVSNSSGRTIDVENRTGGTVTFSGAVSATGGTGVLLTNTTGTIAFSGGVQLSTGANAAFTASGAGSTVNVSGSTNTLTTTTGTTLSLTGIAGTLAFSSVSANGAATGIGLTNVGAGVTIGGGTIQATTTTGVSIDGGNGTFSDAGTVSNSNGRTILVQNRTGGAVTFSGNLTSGGTGILVQHNTSGAPTITFSGATKTVSTGANAAVTLDTNTGATVTFSGGGLAITTTSGAGFSATGGGTVNVTGAANTLASTTGAALNVANTTIGASGLTFRSIASNGAATGIILNTTGSSGGLTVTGNAGSCTSAATCTGGAIQNSTGPGISLTSVGGGVSLTRMSINNGGDDGITGASVTGFALDNARVTDNGNAVNESGLDFTGGLTGSASVSSSTISGSPENGMIVTNFSGSLNLTVTSSTLNAISTLNSGNDGLHLDANNTANMTASITGSTFSNNRGDHFQFSTNTSATGTSSITFSGNTLIGDRGSTHGGTNLGAGVTISTEGSSHTSFTLANNNVQGAVDSALKVDLGTNSTASGTLSGTISGNTIGTAATADSGSAQNNGISVTAQGAGTVTAAITNNIVRQYNLNGINVATRLGHPTVDVTITGNTVANPGAFALNGIFAGAGASSTGNGGAADAGTLCAGIGGAGALANSITGAGTNGADPTATDFRVRQRFATTVRLPGYGGTAGDTAAVVTFIKGNNGTTPTGSATAAFPTSGGGFVGGAACTQPVAFSGATQFASGQPQAGTVLAATGDTIGPVSFPMLSNKSNTADGAGVPVPALLSLTACPLAPARGNATAYLADFGSQMAWIRAGDRPRISVLAAGLHGPFRLGIREAHLASIAPAPDERW
jgi:hypothetical protein